MRGKLFWILLLALANFAGAEMPASLDALWSYPTLEVQSMTLNAYEQGGLVIEEVTFSSRKFNGLPTRIFGYFCYPANTKKPLPAILIVHGGGGSASLALSTKWARQNYATLSIDLPGKGFNRRKSRSTGPDMDVPILLKTSDLYSNYLVHAVAAARNAITYLSRRKEVDPSRIGMIGLSWGGVITLLTNGQENRLKAAVNVFGAGYIPEGCTWQDRFSSLPENAVRAWYDFLDPKNFLPTQGSPILFMTGTNDHCYYLPTFQKSYEEVKAPKNLWLIANSRHRFMPFMENGALAWLNKYLKGKSGFSGFEVDLPYLNEEDRLIIAVKPKDMNETTEVKLYYSAGGPLGWTTRAWSGMAPGYKDYEKGVFYFGLPKSKIDPELLYYVTVEDVFGGKTSSLTRSLFKVKKADGQDTFGVTAPLKNVFRHEPPLTLLDGTSAQNAILKYSQADRSYLVIFRQ